MIPVVVRCSGLTVFGDNDREPSATSDSRRSINTNMDILTKGGPNLQSTTETRKLLRCSRETVIFLLKTGAIDGFKFGRNWRVRLDSINQYIESQNNGKSV